MGGRSQIRERDWTKGGWTCGRTIDEEEVRATVLLSPTGKIADDAVDVGRGGHEHVHCVESRLRLAVTCYGFDDLVSHNPLVS